MRPRTERWSPEPPPSTDLPLPTQAPKPQPVEPVARLDLQRYTGPWHEIARLPRSFSRRCDGELSASYRLKADGTLAVHHAFRTTDGRRLSAYGVAAQPQRAEEPAKLKLRFAPDWLGWLPWVWTDYWVIALDDGYRWAMIGDPRRRALRILAREPAMTRELFDRLKARARRMGYDLAPLIVNRRPVDDPGARPTCKAADVA